MSRIKGFFKKKNKLDNRGEAMILMIVAIGIIMFLGMSLLYATATAFMIRNTERHSEETFNSADTGMDLLKNRLTEVESKAAEQGYAKVLNLYSNSSASDESTFRSSFIDGLTHVCVSSTGEISVKDTISGGDEALFFGSSSAISGYNEKAIKNLFKGKSADGDTYDLKCSGAAKLADDQKSVTLKGISLTYKRHDGYVTSVTTDIKLKVPNVTVSSPSRGFEKNILNDYSCVADQGIYLYNKTDTGKNPDTGSFEGSVYTGSLHVKSKGMTIPAGKKVIIGRTRNVDRDKNGNVTKFRDDRTDGQLTVDYPEGSSDNGGGITLLSNAELWTQDINLTHDSPLESQSNSSIYVADDLNFKDGGSAQIAGNYYGFGNGTSPSNSSSIVFNTTKLKTVNGSKTIASILDFSQAQSVMLAGRSFIMEDDSKDNSANIGMGSSITAKSEQRAYLIPAGSDDTILGSGIQNPQKVTDVSKTTKDIETLVLNNKDKKVFNMDKPLKSYWTDGKPKVKTLSYPIKEGDKITGYLQYYFFDFDSIAEANAYFKDYFNTNISEINQYINQYADIKELKSSVFRTAGTGISKENGSDSLNVTDAVSGDELSSMNSQADKYQREYDNLSDTLDEKSAGEKTPFYSMIDIDNLHATCQKQENNRLVPVAWWTDHQNLEPVDSEDNIRDINGTNVLVVVNKLYYERSKSDKNHKFVMFIYENGTVYKLTLKNSGDTLVTTPAVGDNVLIVNGKDYKVEQYTGSMTSEERSNIVAVVETKEAKTPADKGAGYVAWGDFNDENYTQVSVGDTQLNFLVVDGNVTIKSEFHGIIMCSGLLEIRGAKVYLQDNRGSKILARTHIWSANSGGSKSASSEDWTLGKMVVYENWKKN